MPGLLETLEDIQYGHEAHRKLVEEVYLGPFRVCPLFSSCCSWTMLMANFTNRPSRTISRSTLIWWRLPSTLLHWTRIRILSNQNMMRGCKGWPPNLWR